MPQHVGIVASGQGHAPIGRRIENDVHFIPFGHVVPHVGGSTDFERVRTGHVSEVRIPDRLVVRSQEPHDADGTGKITIGVLGLIIGRRLEAIQAERKPVAQERQAQSVILSLAGRVRERLPEWIHRRGIGVRQEVARTIVGHRHPGNRCMENGAIRARNARRGHRRIGVQGNVL